jgi:Secretion system C-terminal sorting domain
MKRIFQLIVLSAYILFASNFTLAQTESIYGPDTANYKREIYKIGNNNAASYGLYYNDNPIEIGYDGSAKYRAYFQWNISNDVIPSDAIIDSAIVFFIYDQFSTIYYINVNYYNVGADLVSPNLDTLWNRLNWMQSIGSGQGNKYGYSSEGSTDTVISKFTSGSAFTDAILNSVNDGKFILGVKANTENYDYTWQIDTYTVTIHIYYRLPQQSVTIDQKLTNNTSYGSVAHYESSTFVPYSAPHTFSFAETSTQYFRADTNAEYQSSIYQKNNNWNNDNTNVINYNEFEISSNMSSIYAQMDTVSNATIENVIDGNTTVSSTIQFTDPWFRDKSDALGIRNRGSAAIAHTLSSPFTPNISTDYKGVFLNQDYNTEPDYYNVSFPTSQTVSVGGTSHKLYFQNWSASPSGSAAFQNANSTSTPVVFKSANATVQANVKATQLSSDAFAFSNNSQRRLIETQSGTDTVWLHQVYTSLGHVWIEHSSDGGSSWILGNNGQPLDGTTGGKCPSIAYTHNSDYNYIGVVWEQPSGSHYAICGKIFNQYIGTSDIPHPMDEADYTIFTEPSDAYSVNANPNLVLTSQQAGPFFITYERKSTSGSLQPGINWVVGYITDSGIGGWDGPFGTVESNGIISGTNASTIDIQMSPYPGYENSNDVSVNLLRQQGSPGTIYSHGLYLYKDNGTWNYYQYNDGMVSYNANVNWNPSIASLNNYYYAASWIEYGEMVFYSLDYGVRYYYGSNVQSCSINRGGSDTSNGGFAVWSDHPSSWVNKSIRYDNDSPVSSSISTLSTSGEYVQAGNSAGSSLSNMYAESFYPFSSPYYFKTSSSLGPLSKITPVIAEGRGFIINDGGASFNYRFENLNVDGKYINFVDVPDTLDFGNLDVLSNALVTEPFQVNADSKISFTERSGFADSAAAVKALEKNNFIHYKIELIDNSTGDVLGTVKDVNITPSDTYSLKDPSYSLNTNGLSGKTVKVKIVVETNLVSSGDSLDENSVKFLQNDKIPAAIRNARKNVRHSNIILTKSLIEVNDAPAIQQANTTEQLSLQKNDVPKTYALNQNYPNPFNPTSVITYQLPVSGYVTLKVYDVLGRLVKTLVDGDRSAGAYTAEFNGSDLASGVYFYQLRVNGSSGNKFTSTKKLMLLK